MKAEGSSDLTEQTYVLGTIINCQCFMAELLIFSCCRLIGKMSIIQPFISNPLKPSGYYMYHQV